MKFHSPIFMRQCEFHALKMGLQRRACPIPTSVAFHGIVPIVPVKVSSLLLRSFEPTFLGSKAPILDMDVLRDADFPYVFDENGVYDEKASNAHYCNMAVEYDTYFAGFRVRDGIRNGDILLASRAPYQ